MIHLAFGHSQLYQSISQDMTTTMSTSSMAAPDLKLQQVAILHDLSYCLTLSIMLSLLTFSWRRSVHTT
jgi:hypothetical protein